MKFFGVYVPTYIHEIERLRDWLDGLCKIKDGDCTIIPDIIIITDIK